MIRSCEADDFSGLMVCGRCGHAWPSDSERPKCKDRADPAITFAEMVDLARTEAACSTAEQRALVLAQLRKEPDMPTLRKASVWLAIADLIELVKTDTGFKQRLKEAP